jgi:hypothetical protein
MLQDVKTSFPQRSTARCTKAIFAATPGKKSRKRSLKGAGKRKVFFLRKMAAPNFVFLLLISHTRMLWQFDADPGQ